MIVNKAGLSEIFGRSSTTVNRWVAKNCPHKKNGRNFEFDPAKVFDWVLYEAGQKLDINQERAALAQKQREKIELDIAARKRELIPADEIVKNWSNHITAARARLLSLPSKAAPHLAATNDQAEAEKVIMSYMEDALNELSS